ncbi:hypothetical protein [Methanoregula sp.]|uniref:hypothetical protein n=1 Tax=Methanoregula sp. TaxID=2052170 RepID=UPI003566D50C
MKEDTRWKLLVALGLVTLSLALYTVHFLIFQDAQHILIYLVGDIAFLPIEVLVVTLIIDEMLESREKQQRMEKLNLVIGTFFSTEGTPLLALLARADPKVAELRRELVVRDTWTPAQFRDLHAYLTTHPCGVSIDHLDRQTLQEFLFAHEEFVLRIVENPMVFEHESFTGLMLALGHLTEELKARKGLATLPPADRVHLERDANRVYTALIDEWLRYMEYIRGQYPYLFSLAMRTNPFDESASVVVS